MVFPISTRIDITVHQNGKCFIFVKYHQKIFFIDCTFVGASEILVRQTLPFWWDDVADFDVLEDVANAAFNKV